MKRFSRRAFGASLAVTATRPWDAVGSPLQEESPPDLSGQDQKEVDAKVANVLRKYGERLSAEQKQRTPRIIARHQEMLARVRAFPVENGDAPASVLRLYPDPAEKD